MPDADSDLPAPLPQDADTPPQPETARRLILVAIGWFLLATMPVTVSFFLGIDLKAYGNEDFLFVVLDIVTDIVLVISIFVRGRVVGHGNVRAGVGDGPIARLPIIVTLGILAAAYPVIVIVGYRQGYINLSGGFGSPTQPESWLVAFSIFRSLFIAPVVEELIFRGWLWTGLQKRWSTLPIVLVTSALFIAIHFPPTIVILAVRIPGDLLLAAARHFGRSVRAPIALHVINNLTGC